MGKIFTSITDESLNIKRAVDFCRAGDCGAEILFIGTVRNTNGGRNVEAVLYDGHAVLCKIVLNELCREAESRYGNLLNIWIEHRLGRLKVGEESLVIHVTSPHRVDAYEASRFLIEQVKIKIPVWKQEIYCEGDSSWLPGNSLNV